MREKIVLVDGHSIMNRTFYGIPDLTNAKGIHTNAVYGFLNILFKVLEEEKASHLAVAFDVSAPTFRHAMFEAYKGTRKPTPEELRQQIPVMKQVLKAMGILVLEKAGLEADDILGTLAKSAEEKGYEVALVSGDRDLLQIASSHIKIRIPKTKGGGRTEVEDYFADDVVAKYQVDPTQFIELKALMGDTADNIPGVPKIGEKTATELLVTYGTIENIYANIEEISKKSVRETLAEHRDLAELSKKLATIDTRADIEFDLKDAVLGNFYTREAYDLFTELEFKNLLTRFSAAIIKNDQSDSFREIEDFNDCESIFAECEKKDILGFSILDEKDGEFIGIALAYDQEEAVFVKARGFITKSYLLDKMKHLEQTFQREKKTIVAFDIKRMYGYLTNTTTEHFFDIKLAAYLLNPLRSEYMLEDIANEQLGLMIRSRNQIFGKLSLMEAEAQKPEELKEFACYQAYVALHSYEPLKCKLEEMQMWDLFREMEMPLTYVLYDMEKAGLKVQAEELKIYGQKLLVRMEELEKKIYEEAGERFNINSPKQIGEILFERMEIPGGKKTKTGYSTAADVLEKLAPEYPIVEDILEYRGLTKLKSTYADGLAGCIGPDGRIHSSFNQMITATGRISSTEPNLQNIPTRMELGRLIRKVFVPEEGYLFVDADYSQIELRLLAHMAADELLLEAYRSGDDIHRITASRVFHTPLEEVTPLQRRNAKAVNFGIVYGISSFGLSQDLSISRKEAKQYIDHYFETYTGVKHFLEGLVESARQEGYTTTLFGRRRPIPELSSSNFMQRQFGERVAMNAPLQGTAADIMKRAMIHVHDALKEAGLQSRIVLQVHDELLIEAKQEEVEIVSKILEKEMKEAASLRVSLDVDLHTGKDWYEAK